MQITPHALKFFNAAETPVGSVMLKATAVKYAVKGKLTEAALSLVGTTITAEINKIVQQLDKISESLAVAAGEVDLEHPFVALKAKADAEKKEAASKLPFGTSDGPDFLKKVKADPDTAVAAAKPTIGGKEVKSKPAIAAGGTVTGSFKSSTPFPTGGTGTGSTTFKTPCHTEIPKVITEVLNMDQVKLVDAQTQYQKVFGTSNGAIYYAIALFSDLKIAIKIKDTTVSIRAEGDIPKYKSNLEAGGLSIKGSGYASVHLNCNSGLMLKRAVGASLMSMGVAFDTPIPNLSYLGVVA